MALLRWSVCAVVALALVSCTSSSGPGPSDELTYPDIPGIVAFYQFNGNLQNEVSDRHHGAATRAVTYVADHNGETDAAIQVGVWDEVLVPDDPELDITGGITLAAWVRPDVFDRAYGAVIDKDLSEAYSFGMHGAVAPDTTHLRSYISDVADGSPSVIPIATQVWSHIAFTFDEATGKDKFYLNGTVVDSGTIAAVLGTSDELLRIGGASTTDDYAGAVDQVAVFDRALTPAEVAALAIFD